MPSWFLKYVAFLSLIVVLFLLLFNVYYFFIRRGVGVAFYIDKVFHKAKDTVLLTPEYRNSVDEYYSLNRELGNKPVIVFLGDSNTKRANIQEYFGDHSVINRGVDSDTTVSLLNRLERNVSNLKIDKLFLLIGYNDLQYRTNNEIVTNIKVILGRIRAQKIYVQSLLPVDSKMRETNLRIDEINSLLKKLCSDVGIEYIDLHKHFLNGSDGLSEKYSLDGFHLNSKGYQVWRELIAPRL